MNEKSGSSNSRKRILQMFDDTIGESETISATVDALKKLPIDDIKRIQEGKFNKFTGALPTEDPLEFSDGPYFIHYPSKNLKQKKALIENATLLKKCKKENFILRFIRFIFQILHKRKKDD
ncbi:hypothetical protein WKH56_09040 [Priestia sp. SB1]|uniref:hypothetical protein n=1 Tax=Priestia TaxID=2800373 RepID=UPI0031801BB3